MVALDNRLAHSDTCYAPAARMSDEEVRGYAGPLLANPVIDTLLKSIGGFLAILNEQRQILAANDNFLMSAGVADVESVLGLRPGEALQCIHAGERPGGCGTTEYCATCGVVVAIMTCLGNDEPVASSCCLTIRKDGVNKELYFSARAFPMVLDGRRLVVLFMQDISVEQRRAVLERAFFSEVSGTIAAVLGRSKLLLSADTMRSRQLAEDVFQALIKLAQEVRIQKSLLAAPTEGGIAPMLRLTSVADILKDVVRNCESYPVAAGKVMQVEEKAAGFKFKTDAWLLQRVIGGMVLNALEASVEGDTVRLTAELIRSDLVISVWNRRPIQESVARRIFQQNFTTHLEPGRGMGTYFMKVIGEQSLGGRVDFFTSEAEGTTFRIILKV